MIKDSYNIYFYSYVNTIPYAKFVSTQREIKTKY